MACDLAQRRLAGAALDGPPIGVVPSSERRLRRTAMLSRSASTAMRLHPLLILLILQLVLFSLLPASTARAFKPKGHYLIGQLAAQPILSGRNAVVIGGSAYPVRPAVAEAIRTYPRDFR